MLLGALAGAEMAMADAGIDVVPGSGVAAAQDYWRGAPGARRAQGACSATASAARAASPVAA
jgi:alanine-glyoxylate transaminase/serine-glyoxylate transaminase/serine-pyruvate transaminase